MKIDESFFKKINLLTIISVIVLVLIGGIVRNMDAGMGCPDWPKCFDNWIPPLTDETLPQGYKEKFHQKQLKKNIKLANVLNTIGLNETSNKILNNTQLFKNLEFDVIKAWIEYLNRIVGVLIGFFIVVTSFISITFWKKKKIITIISFLSLLLVIFQGWVGSLLVSTHLLTGFISFHMLLAFLLVAQLVYVHYKIDEMSINVSIKNGFILKLLLTIFILQLILGVVTREQVDLLNSNGVSRNDWVINFDYFFYIHRSLSLLIVGLSLYIFFQAKKMNDFRYFKLSKNIFILIVVEIFAGIIMVYFDFPKFIQPIHLFIASIIFALLFYLNLMNKNKIITN